MPGDPAGDEVGAFFLSGPDVPGALVPVEGNIKREVACNEIRTALDALGCLVGSIRRPCHACGFQGYMIINDIGRFMQYDLETSCAVVALIQRAIFPVDD
jgi:hypothetical protein